MGLFFLVLELIRTPPSHGDMDILVAAGAGRSNCRFEAQGNTTAGNCDSLATISHTEEKQKPVKVLY